MHHVQQWGIVFVDEHHCLLAGFFRNVLNQFAKTNVGVDFVRGNSESSFVLGKYVQQIPLQLLLVQMLSCGEAERQHGIFRPFRLKFFDVEPFEEFLPPLEIALEHGNEQRLPKASGPAQKDVATRT